MTGERPHHMYNVGQREAAPCPRVRVIAGAFHGKKPDLQAAARTDRVVWEKRAPARGCWLCPRVRVIAGALHSERPTHNSKLSERA